MARSDFYTFCAFFILMIFTHISASDARENLRFGQKLGLSSERFILKYLDDKPNSMNIAKIDLNEDGLSEFILKSTNCLEIMCDYTVLADSAGTPIILGTINARTIALGNGYTHGVRNLHAFQSHNNDFKYTVYVWEPSQSQYILLKEKPEDN